MTDVPQSKRERRRLSEPISFQPGGESVSASAALRRKLRLQSYARGSFSLTGSPATASVRSINQRPSSGGQSSRHYASEGCSPTDVSDLPASPARRVTRSHSPCFSDSPNNSRRCSPRRRQVRRSTGRVSIGSATWESYCQKRGAFAIESPSLHDSGEYTITAAQLGLAQVHGYLMDLDGEDFQRFRAALRASCFCMAMSDTEALELAQDAALFEFADGDEVVTEGGLGTHFFVVKDGEYSVATSSGVDEVMGPGDSFGEVPLIHGCRQLQTVAAKGAGTCWGIKRDAFRSALTALASRVHQENLALLDQVRLFKYLDKQQKILMSKTLVVQIYEKGRIVMQEGHAHTNCLYIVKSGRVEVTVKGNPVTTYTAGDFFGERSLLYDEPRGATIVALENTMIFAVARQLLEEVLGRDFTDVMWRHIILMSLRDVRLPFRHNYQTVTNAFIIKNFPPGSDIITDAEEARGLRLIVVLVGRVSVTDQDGTTMCINRGQCFGQEYLEELSRPFRHCVRNDSGTACKLALLSADAVAALLADRGKDLLTDVEKIACLRKVYIFRHLPNHHLKLIASSFRTIVRRQGDKVIKEGDIGSLFFVIQSGELIVTLRDRTIRTLGKSDYFGERALLYDEPRTATVTCQSKVAELMVIDKAVFMHIVEGKMAQHLEERIRLQQTDVTFTDLRMVRILGRGTFGVVKLVEHRTHGTQYALKCINRSEATSNQQQENLRVEREILLENDHPFIVKVLRTFKDVGFLYFLTELVTGGELYSAIREIGILNREQAQFYVGSLILALESLHERSIAYRDLKPENVLLDSQGFAKLIDFGCAAKLQGASYSIVGTPHYMAPEVILGHGYRLSCDVWSLGVCLYEFMCGPLPFANNVEDPMQVFREILSAKLRFPHHLVDGWSLQLIRRLLRRRLELRIGCGKLGWRPVRRHGFFRGFSFDGLLSRQIEPPFVPQEHDQLGEPDDQEEEGDGSSASERSGESAFSDVDSSEEGKGEGLLPIAEDGWDKDF